MIPSQIREHLKRVPFRPLRICLSDGSSHDVRHPEHALVTKYNVAIAIGTESGELPERLVCYDPARVIRIEPVSDTAGSNH